MKNRITVRHGMLGDLTQYLKQSGWTIGLSKAAVSTPEKRARVWLQH